jgi:hypothetical protein
MPSSPVASHPFVIEDHGPLSSSKLWDLQRQLYLGRGIKAWREGSIPHFITSNSFAARSYARVTLAHLRSVFASDATAMRTGARILELGAGPGRFAFHFLEHFLPMWHDAGFRGVPVTYVMTDLVARNVDFWRAHPAFAPHLEAGHVVFTTCDVEDASDLQRVLETSAPAQRPGPLVVFANYVFDALRPDLLYFDEGRSFEGLVSLRASRPRIDLNDPLAEIALEIRRRHLERPPFEQPGWNRILDGYRARGGSSAVLFPSSTLRCLERLRSHSPGSVLVLAADEGSHRAEVVTCAEPRLLTNGTSPIPAFPVNFHALGEYTMASGGEAFFANHELGGLCVAALSWDGTGRECGAARQAFHDALDLFGPAELFLVAKSLERIGPELTCQEMLAMLRWSAWDAKVLQVLLANLRARLSSATPAELAAWRDALERVWSLYFHIDAEEGDFAFGIGAALAGVGDWKGAAAFFERSRQVWGADGNTLYNLGVCHARLGDRRVALACVEGVLAATPDHDRALNLRRELLAQEAR